MRSRNHFRLREKKRYEARRFHNPYFQNKQKRNWKAIACGIGVVVAISGACAFVFGSRYFAIASVTASGMETLSSEEIVDRSWTELNQRKLLFFRASNRFLYRETSLRDALSSAYSFEQLSIEKTCSLTHGGCSIFIQIKERTSQLLWVSEKRVFLVDLQGVVTRELSPEERTAWETPDPPPVPNPDGTLPPPVAPIPLKRLPIFEDANDTPISIGSTVFTPQEITNLFAFQKGLTEAGIGFSKTKIDRLAGKWMAVRTTIGYDILMDALGDIGAQLTNLQTVLRDKIPDPSAITYIDLRFGDHVYYK